MTAPTAGAGDPSAAHSPAQEQLAPDMPAEDYRGAPTPGFDPSVPSPARMYDYYLGGKTSDAVKLSSCVRKFPDAGGEGGGFVVVLAGGEAVVQAAEQAAEQVALGGGVPVAGVASPVVVGAGAG